MTQIENQIALRAYLADFSNFESLWKAIEQCRTHINAAEGIDFTSKLLEIRIPFGFEYDHFKHISKSDVPFIPHHKYTFIACLGSFNWCAIFDTPASLEMYTANHVIDTFEITWAERNRILGEDAKPATNRRPISTMTLHRQSDCICKPVNDFELDTSGCPLHDVVQKLFSEDKKA